MELLKFQVHPETIIKRNAKQEIEQDAQSQIDTINANNKSTNEEKSAAIDRVNVAKIDAINNITNATTTQLVNDAKIVVTRVLAKYYQVQQSKLMH